MKRLMHTKYLGLLALVLLVLISSCREDEPTPEPKPNPNTGQTEVLSLDVERVDFTKDAGSRTIKVKTQLKTWTVKSPVSWCVVKPKDNGTLILEVKKNTGKNLRETDVVISFGKDQKKIHIRQIGVKEAGDKGTILVNTSYFTVPKSGNRLEVEITADVPYEIKSLKWIKEGSNARVAQLITRNYTFNVPANTGVYGRTGQIVILEKGKSEIEGAKATIEVYQKGSKSYTPSGASDLKGDILVKIKNGTASQENSYNESIKKSFDGDRSSLYHSPYGNGTKMPVTLVYNFTRYDHVDYILYHPRPGGNPNGNFGEISVEYKNAQGQWVHVLDQDLHMSSAPSKLELGQKGVNTTSIRITVKSGKNGFVSCAEMDFYKYSNTGFKYSDLFKDITCSDLKEGITVAEINKCSEPFYKKMAMAMFEQTYDREFRIAEFKAYPYPDIQANINRTNAYSFKDNPTGIKVEAGDDFIVFVGDSKGFGLSLQVQGLYPNSEKNGFLEGFGPGGDSYPLSKGYNKIKITKPGLVYVNYYVNDLSRLDQAPKVKIHFATGKVNGYFDTQNPSHVGRWRELLDAAVDDCFDLVGEYAQLTMPVHKFKELTPDGKALVDQYDLIVKSEMELLGLYKYNKVFKNRMCLNVMYSGYMHATWGHTDYNYTTLGSILKLSALKGGAVWGPAHEIGHMNQTRPGVRWIGMTEVTNNIMSEYIQTSITRARSRLQCEPINWGNNRYTKAWNGVIVHQLPLSMLSLDPNREADKIPAQFKEGGKPASYLFKDVFCQLVPFWQLELYFGNVKKMSPRFQNDKGGFYPKVYEWARTHDFMGQLPGGDQEGVYQTDFAYIASKAAGYDLTDFFVKWGFLREMPQTEIDDYRRASIHITTERVNEVKNRIKSLKLPKINAPIEYITDRSWSYFKYNKMVSKGSNAVVSGSDLVISGWNNVVAYEIWDKPYAASGSKLVYVGDGCVYNGDYSLKTSQAKLAVCGYRNGYHVYAVQVDNKRIEVPVN